MAQPNLQEIHDFLVETAHKAGSMITTAKPRTSASGEKKNSADLVTETDRAVEAMISSCLISKYPSYSFMGEETYKPGDKLTPAPTFIVDPIDGTTNFVHAYPYVSISLGFAVNLKPMVGVVYNPFTKTMYSAVKGKGAFRNLKERLPLAGEDVQGLESLDKAQIAIEWGSDRSGPDYALKVRTFARLAGAKEEGGAMVHSLRSFGSAALNFCGVAEGGLDAYWEGGCWAWDVCAGWVILEEAGGKVVDGNPGNWTPAVDGRRYFAVRKGVTDAVIEEFWAVVGEGRMSYSA